MKSCEGERTWAVAVILFNKNRFSNTAAYYIIIWLIMLQRPFGGDRVRVIMSKIIITTTAATHYTQHRTHITKAYMASALHIK